MSKDIGIRLKHARKLRALTQPELATRSGLSQSTISELETGESHSPWGVNLVRLAQALDISANWLATGKGPMDGSTPPLPPEAERVARNWLRLDPQVRVKVADMIQQMVEVSSADKEPASDERVAETYGKPGRKSDRKQK